MNFVIQSTLSKNKKIHYFIITIITFTFLFHKAGAGLNLAIFEVITLLFLITAYPQRFSSKAVIAAAAFTMVSAICTAWYGSVDTVLWGIFCLGLLSQQVLYPGAGILLFETRFLINLGTAPFHFLSLNLTSVVGSQGAQTDRKLIRYFITIVIPLILAFIFANIYRTLNPYFEKVYLNLTGMLDYWILLTLFFGILVAAWIWFAYIPEGLLKFNKTKQDAFNEKTETVVPNPLEKQAGISLFVLLNILLTFFLISDFAFINNMGEKDVNYSQYVHSGIGMLILSIIMATSFILFFFRNSVNSSTSTRSTLKVLAIVWVILNMILVASTTLKNLIYVNEMDLTLKRIGVFIYLIMALAGLGFALSKIILQKTNSYLIRRVYWSFFTILTLNLCIDWTSIITNYNINRNIEQGSKLDWQYLLDLDNRNLPIIQQKNSQLTMSVDEVVNFNTSLQFKINQLKRYEPDWREMHLSTRAAKNEVR